MNDYKHISVLLEESIEGLAIKEDGIYVDCTLGGGGHSSEILSKLTTGRLYAFDQDEYALHKANKFLTEVGTNFTLIKDNFVHLKQRLLEFGVTEVDGILYDLGVSSFQFDIPERGFSYNYDAPLDMRMNQEQPLSAKTIVNVHSESELRMILWQYGEEKFAPQIARKIVTYRKTKAIETTFELVDIIKSALPAAIKREKGHPAKKTFQALRIAVNDELRVFETSLKDALTLLKPKGRIVVITFHSLEDRICKHMFREVTTLQLPVGVPFVPSGYEVKYRLINQKVITASSSELESNNRAHSAKLRIIEKL
ncbi:MAG TPA: 16S rRNA (cytosine(1402)-N(4))-methyltransferase RsmH [Bacilli bacterium]|nr:16S rRNA (cytosine(1402)-N(4))-methyltransferase RsmH [Bacilli bacterium]